MENRMSHNELSDHEVDSLAIDTDQDDSSHQEDFDTLKKCLSLFYSITRPDVNISRPEPSCSENESVQGESHENVSESEPHENTWTESFGENTANAEKISAIQSKSATQSKSANQSQPVSPSEPAGPSQPARPSKCKTS